MKAVVLSGFDRAPEVTELEVPEPGPGELRVRVRSASVNGFDVSVAKGRLKGVMEHRFPVVLGKDFAGIVDALGEGVTSYAVGQRVFGVVVKDVLGAGSFAEYVTVPAAVGVAKLPDAIDFTDAGALGLAGTAASDSVDAADIRAGSTALIAGATGGVGQHALQLAAKYGAKVIATAQNVQQAKVLKDLGAACTVDYTGDLAAQMLALYPDGVDAVLHFAGDPAVLVPVVKPGGVLVSTIALGPAPVPSQDIRVVPIYAQPTTATLERLARSHAEGHPRLTIQRVYDLAQTAEALEQFSAGTLGKLVISID